MKFLDLLLARSPGARSTSVISAVLLSAMLGGCAQWPDLNPQASPSSATSGPTSDKTTANSGATGSSAQSAPAGSTKVEPTVAQPSAAATSPTVVEPPVASAPVDPLRPEVRVDLDDRAARQDLWQRIRGGFAMPNLDGDLVRKAEQLYASKPDYVQRMNERGGRYLFHIVEEVQRRKMPTELALLPFVESAFNPEAMSHARASGMWQFMPATGRVFNLRQNVFRDDRRDVLASTRAALDYLTKLHGMFGDWHLALAAYNWGEGSVGRAIARNKAQGLPTDYQSLGMPNETRFYVPKLQAIKNIVAQPTQFNLSLPKLENHPYFLSVGIGRDIDVELAARFASLPMADFKALNPQLNKPVILAAGTPQVLLPYDNAKHFSEALAKHRGAFATWTAWTVPATMKSADAAQKAGMSHDQFRSVNHIPPRMLVKAGSTVLVPRGANKTADVPEHIADNGALSLAHEAPPTRRVMVKVGGKGDTVVAIAKRYRVSPAQIAQWNKLASTGRLSAGTTLVLHVPHKAKGTRYAKAVKGKKSRKVTASRSVKLAAQR